MSGKSKDPLHGITLEMILTALVDTLGWRILSRIIEVRCFYNDPSIKSSLKFLRKTEWARKKVEALFLTECPNYYETKADRIQIISETDTADSGKSGSESE